MGVYKRGSKLWITFREPSGKWRNVSTKLDVGQEERAERILEDVLRELAATGASTAGPLTVRGFAGPWLEERQKLDLDWKNDKGALENHILPVIGDMPIADVRTRHIVELVNKLRTATHTIAGVEKRYAPRTVYNVYSVLSALFRDAKLADRIEQTPCELGARQLGSRVDGDPGWRSEAVFARQEAETLISDERIPADRRVVYALELLAGVRPGEAAALRWRHYDATMEPLGKLTIAFAYNTRKDRQKSTKTQAVKHVPVHPTLAAILAEWKLSGWAAMFGRPPEPDDLIVPLPPAAAERRRTRKGEPFRGHDYSGKRWREEDLPALGWRHRRHYDMRATFITLAIEDGADELVLETRVTHTKKGRSAFTGYDRGAHWERTCAEVAKLKIVRATSEVIALPIAAVAGDSPDSATAVVATSENSKGKEWRRRESNSTLTLVPASPSVQSREVGVAEMSPSGTGERTAAVGSLQPDDPIANALESVAAAWRSRRETRELRRGLLKLLAELE